MFLKINYVEDFVLYLKENNHKYVWLPNVIFYLFIKYNTITSYVLILYVISNE